MSRVLARGHGWLMISIVAATAPPTVTLRRQSRAFEMTLRVSHLRAACGCSVNSRAVRSGRTRGAVVKSPTAHRGRIARRSRCFRPSAMIPATGCMREGPIPDGGPKPERAPVRFQALIGSRRIVDRRVVQTRPWPCFGLFDTLRFCQYVKIRSRGVSHKPKCLSAPGRMRRAGFVPDAIGGAAALNSMGPDIS